MQYIQKHVQTSKALKFTTMSRIEQNFTLLRKAFDYMKKFYDHTIRLLFHCNKIFGGTQFCILECITSVVLTVYYSFLLAASN